MFYPIVSLNVNKKWIAIYMNAIRFFFLSYLDKSQNIDSNAYNW